MSVNHFIPSLKTVIASRCRQPQLHTAPPLGCRSHRRASIQESFLVSSVHVLIKSLKFNYIYIFRAEHWLDLGNNGILFFFFFSCLVLL